MSKIELRYTAVFEPCEEGGYVVTFPAFPDLATQGETLEEARAMAEDCLRCHLEGLHKDGLPLPEADQHDAPPIAERVRVELEAV